MPYLKDYAYTQVTPEMVPGHPEWVGRWYVHMQGDRPWLNEREPNFATKKEAQGHIRGQVTRQAWPGAKERIGGR